MDNMLTWNDNVIFYPTDLGWQKIIQLLKKSYSLSTSEAVVWISKRRTKDDGYQEQLWVIIQDFHEMFYNGQQYLKNTSITIVPKINN